MSGRGQTEHPPGISITWRRFLKSLSFFGDGRPDLPLSKDFRFLPAPHISGELQGCHSELGGLLPTLLLVLSFPVPLGMCSGCYAALDRTGDVVAPLGPP